MLIRLLSSPWFWADVALSISGGLLVYLGLKLEKEAEKLIPPSDFKPDVFEDVLRPLKQKMERGWRILMTGIVLEVIAAFGISVISGLEMADLTEKSESQRVRAEGMEIKIRELTAVYGQSSNALAEATNVLAQANGLLIDAESKLKQAEDEAQKIKTRLQPRTITPEQRKDFIDLLSSAPKGPVRIGATNPNQETRDFREAILSLVKEAGYQIQSYMDYFSPITVHPMPSIGVVVNAGNRPEEITSRAQTLAGAFRSIGIECKLVIHTPTDNSPDLQVATNEVLVFVFEKP